MKGPEAFRTISEVADELDLPQHVLRFWETRFNQIKPMKRGGGRRYYRPEDVNLLRGIRLLLYAEGFTIRGVQRLLKEKGVGFVTSVGQTGSVETMTVAEAAAEAKPDAKAAKAAASLKAETAAAGPAVPEPSPLRVEQPVRRPSTATERDADRRRIEAALGELQEAKRLLDSAF